MRIRSGSLKGREIKFKFRSHKPRPTQGVVKEAIFSILGSKINDAFFLDLFAGSGGVGIEAYSNGAKLIYFVENNIDLFKSLKSNFENFKLDGDLFFGHYQKAIDYFSRKKNRFNIIFVDPPYELIESSNYSKILTTIVKKKIISQNGILIIERGKKSNPPSDEILKNLSLELISNKYYGDTFLDIYQENTVNQK